MGSDWCLELTGYLKPAAVYSLPLALSQFPSSEMLVILSNFSGSSSGGGGEETFLLSQTLVLR